MPTILYNDKMYRKNEEQDKTPSKKSSVRTSEKRILVIGHSLKSRSLKSFTWEELPKDCNIADYDVVIIDFTTFDEKTCRIKHKDHPIKDDYLYDFLSNPENEMLLIGEPYHIENIDGNSGRTYIIDFKYLFPVFPSLTEAQGEEIRDIDKEYSYYFSQVKRWNGKLKYKGTKLFVDLVNPTTKRVPFQKMFGCHPINDVKLIISPIAKSVSKHPIAFSFSFFRSNVHKYVTAKIVCLPITTEIPVIEGIKLLLQYRYGLKLESELPEWVDSFKLPEQMEIESKISGLENKKSEIDNEINSLSIRLKESKKFQKLLYESGKSLEDTVYDALELIGATVDRKENFQDDGLITDPFDRKYTLEIKGRGKKSAARGDIRQLVDWMDAAKVEKDWKGKGLLIVNAYRELPLQERKVPFPDDCVKKAEFEEICLLTTTQLFRALQAFQEGKLERKDLWGAIFNANGICDLPELREN